MFLEALCCFQISILLSMSYTFMHCVLRGCYFLFEKILRFSTKAMDYIKTWIESLEDAQEELEDADEENLLDNLNQQNNFNSVIL